MIKCYYCKGKHETVLQVKDCSKVEIGTIVSEAHAAITTAQQALTVKPLVSEIHPAKVEIGTIVEDAPAPVALVIPEHRIKPNMAKAASFTVGAVTTDSLTEVQALIKETIVKKGQDLDLGMYQVDGTVYKVKFNKAGTYKYVEKLYISQKHVWDVDSNDWKLVPKGKFGYANGMIYSLTSENKMDEAAAKAFHDATKEKYGQQYGFCCVCGKLLTVKKSIEAGVGPVCGSKL